MTKKVVWQQVPLAEHYEAARSYLRLVMDDRRVARVVGALHKARTVEHEAKDILRASDLPLLDASDPHVARDYKKLQKRKKLSPVLLVRGDAASGVPMIICDGYHRICASYYWDENAPISCRIVSAGR